MKLVCYTVPLVSAGILSIVWFAGKRGAAGWWLNLLLYGAALFGFVDHLWNGELFLMSSDWVMDVLLGSAITGSIFGGWVVTLGLVKLKPELGYRMGIVRTADNQ